MNRKGWVFVLGFLAMVGLSSSLAFSAYQHQGEGDSPKFLSVYPSKAGTKLDSCALCHSGGAYTSGGKVTTLGSCQWCHYKYGYDKSGDISTTLNPYGKDYRDNGRSTAAFGAIENRDSDGDGYSNKDEIAAVRYPGDATDDPSKITAPFRVYTKAQLQTLAQHTQFLLMNTTKSGDYYAQYSGVPIQDLLARAGMLPSATGIKVYSPDGFSTTHPLTLDPNPSLYHVNGTYPGTTYYYNTQADVKLNPTSGWCDYSAPSCTGRQNGDAINNPNGLKLLLAFQRDGTDLTPGVLNASNTLDGEGPFRVVPPQKTPGPPDQASTASNQAVIWPYNKNADHNAGFSTRSTTIIRVEPLPAGTTDINTLEAGWNYIDQEKIVIYGALNNCSFSLSATSAYVLREGGVGTIDVTPSSSDCTWTAGSEVGWIAISSGSTGTGSGTIRYSVAMNDTTASRTGAITIEGQTFTVTQDTKSSSDSGGGCFIATAAFGSPMDPHVTILREFRDRHLLTNLPGKVLVSLYYRVSPRAAEIIRRHEILRKGSRLFLSPLIWVIQYPYLGCVILLVPLVIWRRRTNLGR